MSDRGGRAPLRPLAARVAGLPSTSTSVVFSIGHLGDMIRAEIGDGTAWGIEVTYVDEGDERIGTGGALRLAVERGAVDDAFFVLYGDSYLSIDLGAVDRDFTARGPDALMTVYRNQGRWETSNAVFERRHGHAATKRGSPIPRRRCSSSTTGSRRCVAAVVLEMVAPGAPATWPTPSATLSRAGRLAGFEATERFFEIGTPSGLADLERHLWPHRTSRTTGSDLGPPPCTRDRPGAENPRHCGQLPTWTKTWPVDRGSVEKLMASGDWSVPSVTL